MIIKEDFRLIIDTTELNKQITWISDRLAVPEEHREEAEGIYNLLTYIRDRLEETEW